MQSVIQPLNKRVSVLQENLTLVVRGLVRGEPDALKQVNDLVHSVGHLKADFKSAYNNIAASAKTTASTMPGLTNPTLLLQPVKFFIQEGMAAIQLLNNLARLLASLLSINTILSVLFAELEESRKMLNKKLVLMNRAIARVKQRASKTLEWEKRKISAKANLLYLNKYKSFLEETITDLEKKTSNNKTVTLELNQALSATKTKLTLVKQEIKTNEDEIAPGGTIDTDKEYWNTRWKKETEQDKKELMSDLPKIGADI